MRTPGYIAVIAAVALFVGTLVPHVLTLLFAPLPNSQTTFTGIFSALLEGAIPAFFIQIGTYIGVRWAAPLNRTARLARVLGIVYFTIGIALTVPIKTRAVVIDVPRASGTGGSLDLVPALVASMGVALIVVVAPLFLARGLAAVCARKSARDA